MFLMFVMDMKIKNQSYKKPVDIRSQLRLPGCILLTNIQLQSFTFLLHDLIKRLKGVFLEEKWILNVTCNQNPTL